MGRRFGNKFDSFNSTLDSDRPEYLGRLPLKERHGSLGVQVEQDSFQGHYEQLQLQLLDAFTSLNVMVQRHQN